MYPFSIDVLTGELETSPRNHPTQTHTESPDLYGRTLLTWRLVHRLTFLTPESRLDTCTARVLADRHSPTPDTGHFPPSSRHLDP